MLPCRALALVFLLAPALAQEVPRARLEGQTTDAVQQPLANCPVTVEIEGEVVGRTNSDAQGFFILGALPQRRVVVRATAGADVGAAAVDLAGVDSGFVHLRVYPARTLRGVVKGPDGAPLAGAWVLAAPDDEPALAVIDACAQTGADGRYRLAHVLAGPVGIKVWAPGCDLFEAEVDGADDVAVDAELEDGPRRVYEFALPDATPQQLAGARLRLAASLGSGLPFPLPPPLRQMHPDAQGVCAVPGWPGNVRLLARFELADGKLLAARDMKPRDRTWRFVFQAVPDAAGTVRGVLRDPEGRPLADKLLLCRPLADAEAAIATVFGRTSADGSFALPSPVEVGEQLALRVVDPEWAVVHAGSRDAGSRSWYVAEHDADVEHSIPAGRAPQIRLRVVDAAGRPVRGVEAVLWQAFRSRDPGEILGSGCSDASGNLELHGIDLLMVDRICLRLRATEGTATCARDLDVRAGDLGTVALAPAATFAGRILDLTGKPVAGVRIRLGEDLVLTGRDGRFLITGLQEGRQHYSAREGRKTWVHTATVGLSAGEVEEVALQRR